MSLNILNIFKYLIFLTYSVLVFNLSFAQSTLFETNERFHPVIGTSGAVATQEKNATEIGIKILENGGNAIDAAVAIGYTLAVTLPRAGNIGGGGFMTIWSNKDQKAYVINYRETAPQNIDITKIQALSRPDFINSYYASGTPGTVAGLNLAAKKFGTMPLEKLIQPAINLAKNGFNLNITQIEGLNFAKEILEKNPASKNIFFKKELIKTSENTYKESFRLLKLGEKLVQHDLASTLERIATNGNAGFYSGMTADLILKAMQEDGGYISKQDLSNYQAELTQPIIFNFMNHKVIAPPPPSSGGAIIAEILQILEKLNISEIKYNSALYYHYLTEVFNLAYIDRNYNLGDPKFVDNNLNKYTSSQYINKLAKEINRTTHKASESLDSSISNWQEGDNTTHFVVIDKDLNIVSNTYTINTSFGTGKIIPGAGFFMNNELDDFAINLDKPNAYGLIQGKNNLIAPNKQPLSSMTPIIVLNSDNIPIAATGTPGGSRIITTISQIILNLLSNNLKISSSVAAPRIHSQLWPDILYYEQGISPDTLEKLKSMGHTVNEANSMGSVQSVMFKTPYFMAYSDPRRAGSLAKALITLNNTKNE